MSAVIRRTKEAWVDLENCRLVVAWEQDSTVTIQANGLTTEQVATMLTNLVEALRAREEVTS